MRAALPLLALVGAVPLLGAAAPSAPPTLVWPVACQVGTSCEVQHYVDTDPSAGVKDYSCGNRTYDAHDGVDIRIPDLAAERRGVAVLAAADGKVQGVRDGMADGQMKAGGAAAVKNTECGNGVIVTHQGGFASQYCHMAPGTVKVNAGDVVKAGQALGNVGMSGLAEFPHLHFTLRQDDKPVDPFAYGAAPGTCNGGRSLWRETPAYRDRAVLNVGFAPAAITMDAVENGTAAAAPGADLAFMVAYGRAIGLKAGDVQTIDVKGPDGAVVIHSVAEPLPRDQAQRLLFAGKRKPATGWPKGRYAGTYSVTAGGKVVLSRAFGMTL